MSTEFWAIIGVGVALGGLLLRQSVVTSGIRTELNGVRGEIADLRERLARIEGWIQGRFREGAEA